MLNLLASFEALGPPASGSDTAARFSATTIPGFAKHRIGKDPQGAPTLLVAVAEGSGRAWPAPIVLEHIAVQHDVDCRVTQPDGSVELGRFTVLRCTGRDHMLHSYFLRIAATLVVLLGAEPSGLDVSRAVGHLVELFRSMTAAPQKTVQGLWAEVLLMARLRDPSALAAAWHVLPGDRYDFSAGSQRIEVKSATGRVRRHHFALEQLLPIPGTQVLVASVLVERAGAGTSLLDLVTEVRSKISNDAELLLHFDQVVAQSLGDAWRRSQEERFDRQLAESGLSFFDPAAIPRVQSTPPRGVSNVRFEVDLTGITPADLRAYRSYGNLFASVLRR